MYIFRSRFFSDYMCGNPYGLLGYTIQNVVSAFRYGRHYATFIELDASEIIRSRTTILRLEELLKKIEAGAAYGLLKHALEYAYLERSLLYTDVI